MSLKLKLQQELQLIQQQIDKIQNSRNFNWIKEIQMKKLIQKRTAIQTELAQFTNSTSRTSISNEEKKEYESFEPQGLELFSKSLLSDKCLEDLINIWIVLLGGRQACLIETTHYNDKERLSQTEQLRTFVQLNKLYWTLDPQSRKDYPRYLVSKQVVSLKSSDKQLGKLLGITYLKSDYDNFCVPRTSIYIHGWISSKKKISLWDEASLTPEISIKNAQKMVNTWNQLIQIHPFPLVPKLRFEMFTEVDDGLIIRKEKIEDDKYFLKYFDEYLEDLDNFADDPELYKSFKRKPSGKKQIEQFKMIWLNEMDYTFRKYCFKR